MGFEVLLSILFIFLQWVDYIWVAAVLGLCAQMCGQRYHPPRTAPASRLSLCTFGCVLCASPRDCVLQAPRE